MLYIPSRLSFIWGSLSAPSICLSSFESFVSCSPLMTPRTSHSTGFLAGSLLNWVPNTVMLWQWVLCVLLCCVRLQKWHRFSADPAIKSWNILGFKARPQEALCISMLLFEIPAPSPNEQAWGGLEGEKDGTEMSQ